MSLTDFSIGLASPPFSCFECGELTDSGPFVVTRRVPGTGEGDALCEHCGQEQSDVLGDAVAGMNLVMFAWFRIPDQLRAGFLEGVKDGLVRVAERVEAQR